MSDTQEPHGSLDEETEEPIEMGDEPPPHGQQAPAGGVRMISQDGEEITPPQYHEEIEYLYNEPAPEGVEVLDFDFLQSFLSLTDDLHQHPQVARVVRAMERPVPEFTIRVVESGLGQTIDHELKSLYRMIDDLSFRWESEPGSSNLPGGALHIVPFMRTFGHWVGELWPIEDADREDDPRAQLRWQLRGFDMPEPFLDADGSTHPLGQTLWTVIALREEGDAQHEMYVYHPDEKEFLFLDLTLIDYLYCALGACGAPGWQLLFTDYDFDRNPWQMPHPLAWIDEVAAFFPTFDMAFFRTQYEAIRDAHDTGREQE